MVTFLNAFRQQNGTRQLTFASDQNLMDILGLIPGAVMPPGLLNGREHKVTLWLDKPFEECSGLIGEDVPEHTLFVITTDGMENAGRRCSAQRVKEIIRHQKEKYGWEFLFLGANIDAVETAGHLGIAPDRAVRPSGAARPWMSTGRAPLRRTSAGGGRRGGSDLLSK